MKGIFVVWVEILCFLFSFGLFFVSSFRFGPLMVGGMKASKPGGMEGPKIEDEEEGGLEGDFF